LSFQIAPTNLQCLEMSNKINVPGCTTNYKATKILHASLSCCARLHGKDLVQLWHCVDHHYLAHQKLIVANVSSTFLLLCYSTPLIQKLNLQVHTYRWNLVVLFSTTIQTVTDLVNMYVVSSKIKPPHLRVVCQLGKTLGDFLSIVPLCRLGNDPFSPI